MFNKEKQNKNKSSQITERRLRKLGRLCTRKGGIESGGLKYATTVEDEKLGDRWGQRPERYKSNGEDLAQWVDRLQKQGEKVSWLVPNKFDDIRLIDGLKKWCNQCAIDPFSFIMHSNRFANISHEQRFNGLTSESDRVEIPQADDNLHSDGRQRRHEEHRRLNLDYLLETNIDPDYVLYFRVTQPAQNGPKPEYYWTSDFGEVAHSLWAEGAADGDPQILVSTLTEISKNGGLMQDVNDDNGIAVRQVGLEPFDQQRVMFSFPRFE